MGAVEQGTPTRIVDVSIRVAVPILLGIAGWTATTLVDHEARLRLIEGTRYTVADRDRDIGGLREEVHKLAVAQAVTQQQVATTAAAIARMEHALVGGKPAD